MIQKIIKVESKKQPQSVSILLNRYFVIVELVKKNDNMYWMHKFCGDYYCSSLVNLQTKNDLDYIGKRMPNSMTEKDTMFFDYIERDLEIP